MLGSRLLSAVRRARALIGNARTCVVDPEGEVAFAWSALLFAVMIYNLWAIILRISFSEMRHQAVPVAAFLLCDLVADMIYILDVFLQFRMGYLEDGILVEQADKLATNYKAERRTQFLVDVLAAIPLTNIFILVVGFLSTIRPGVRDHRETIYPLLRLPKLAKWHSFSYFLTTWDMKTNTPNLLRAGKLLLFLATTIHWIGCFYHIISEAEGLGCNTWVLRVTPTESTSPFFGKYLRSVYWSGMTLTTIGNDGHPHTNVEFIFTGCTFLTGVFLFATVVGNVGDVISNMNAARVDFQQKMDGIKMYMRYYNVPTDIQTRVKKWAKYSWNRTQAMDDASTLNILPFRLKAEIAKHVHLETLQKVKIFEGCEQGLLCELVVRLRSQIYSPSDYICRKGEIGKEMYIINHGRVEVQIPNPTNPTAGTVLATLLEGNFFGEISLLKLEEGCNRRNADVRSVGYSELLVLSKRDLNQALEEYPEARRALEKQARDRIQEMQSESSTLTVSNPHLVAERSSGRESPERNMETTRVYEREVSQLAHIIRELKTFDSQATKRELEMLKKRCYLLQRELKLNERLLRRAMDCPACQTASRDTDETQREHDPYNGDVTSPTLNAVTCRGQSERTNDLYSENHYRDRIKAKRKCLRQGTMCSGQSSPGGASDSPPGSWSAEEIENGDVTKKYNNNRSPSVINGCLRLYDSPETARCGSTDQDTISVIVPQICINGEVYQELRALQMGTPDWLRRRTPEAPVVPPLVSVDQHDDNDAANGEQLQCENEVDDVRCYDVSSVMSLTTPSQRLCLPEVRSDCFSDFSDMGSDSD